MREIQVFLAFCAALCAGCTTATSEVETECSLAEASAAVAFAEAEHALLVDKPSAANEASAAAETQPRRRRLLYFTASWCTTCRRNEQTLAALAAAGWLIGTSDRDHIQIIDVDGAVPAWVLIDGGVVVRRAVGLLEPFAVGRLFETER